MQLSHNLISQHDKLSSLFKNIFIFIFYLEKLFLCGWECKTCKRISLDMWVEPSHITIEVVMLK